MLAHVFRLSRGSKKRTRGQQFSNNILLTVENDHHSQISAFQKFSKQNSGSAQSTVLQ
jgi:hypothetical protein